jgi:hypothetical protein
MSKPIFALPFQGHTLDVLHLTYNVQAILLSIFYLASFCIVVTKKHFGKNHKIEKKNPKMTIAIEASNLYI